jgi:hypothetical protein
MATLPDNAIDLIADDEVERYTVVRVADEIVIDLMKSACGISYEEAAPRIERHSVEGVAIPVANKALLIRTKNTVRPSDASDVQFLRLRIAEEGNDSGRRSESSSSNNVQSFQPGGRHGRLRRQPEARP